MPESGHFQRAPRASVLQPDASAPAQPDVDQRSISSVPARQLQRRLRHRTSAVTGRRPYVSGHSLRQHPDIRPRPHALNCHLIGRAGPAEASVWSLTVTTFHLRFFTELIRFNSNFFLLCKCANTTMCMCVSFSQTFLRSYPLNLPCHSILATIQS
jgi:hypothetical protein